MRKTSGECCPLCLGPKQGARMCFRGRVPSGHSTVSLMDEPNVPRFSPDSMTTVCRHPVRTNSAFTSFPVASMCMKTGLFLWYPHHWYYITCKPTAQVSYRRIVATSTRSQSELKYSRYILCTAIHNLLSTLRELIMEGVLSSRNSKKSDSLGTCWRKRSYSSAINDCLALCIWRPSDWGSSQHHVREPWLTS